MLDNLIILYLEIIYDFRKCVRFKLTRSGLVMVNIECQVDWIEVLFLGVSVRVAKGD